MSTAVSLLVMLPLGADLAHAEPTIKENVTYYNVDGATVADVRADLNRKGPISKTDGKRYDAATNWRINWNYTFRSSDQSCSVNAVTVTVEVTRLAAVS